MKRFPLFATAGLVALMATGVASAETNASSDRGGVCISKEANDSLAACPGGMQAFTPRDSKPKSVNLGAVAPMQNGTKKPQINPDQEMSASQRDMRRAQNAPRVRQLLNNEIIQLENLNKVTPKNSADRPQLLRRIAETYVERENSAFSQMTRAQIDKNQAVFESEKKVVDASRRSAIAYYTTIVNDYKATYAQLDEVLYFLAYEYEQGQQLDNARKVYFQLINDTPQSKYIPNAYLAFGELFYNEAQTDPSKYELARQSYEKVLQYKAPENKVWGYAEYKVGFVYWNLGEQNLPKALNAFAEVIKFGNQYTQLPGVKALQASARKDIIPVYTLVGKPDSAFGFFKPLSEDAGSNDNTKTFKMMDDLGLNYIDTGHYQDAITLYKDLLNRDKGDNSCKYQSHIVQATMALKGGGNKANTRTVLGDQIQAYRAFKGANHSPESKRECANVTAELVTETAMALHLEAVGSGGTRGTGDKRTMGVAAELYNDVVTSFSKEEFATFEFPRIVKEDWPSLCKIEYAQADLQYFNQDWAGCGPAFDRVVQDCPGPDQPEAAYAAVLCYQKLYDQQHQGNAGRVGTGNAPGQRNAKTNRAAEEAQARAALMKKNMNDSQKGMVGAFNRYLCYVKPGDNDQKAKEQYVDVKYARARTYFETHYWEEAAAGFRDVALNNADDDSGIDAANLYLESLNVIGSHSEPPRPSCFDEMADAVPKIVALYCEGGRAAKNAEQCTQLAKTACDIQRLKADNLVKLAGNGGQSSLKQYEEAARVYSELFDKFGRSQLESGQPAQCERMDEIVFNQAEALQSARLLAKSIAARLVLLDPKYKMDKSDLARRSMYKIGGNYQAIAAYDQAAAWYERYATTFPAGEKADTALSDAIVLRLGLGQEGEAIKDADTFGKQYGGKRPAEAARVAFAIGAHYVERGDYDTARRKLTGAMGAIDKNATLDVQAQAHAMLGKVFLRTKNANGANNEYRRVQDLWKDPKGAADRITNGDPDNGIRRLGKALTAVGEAYFFFAEKEKAKADAITFPKYTGPADRASVLKHVQTKVKDWILKKRPAIEKAEGEYKKVVDLQPEPPPQWVIASGSRVGRMWGNFVAEFRAAPIPADMKRDAELRGIYYESLDTASEPLKQRAKGAYETCLKYSVKYQFFDEFSRECEVWLSKSYKNEYHQIDEFSSAPTLVNSGLSDRPYPLDADGNPINPNPPPPAPPAETATGNDKTTDAKSGPKGGGAKAAPRPAGRGRRK